MSEAKESNAEQPAEIPTARIVSPKEREKMVPLEYPVEFDGKIWTEIKVRRVSAQEVADYLELLKSDQAFDIPPMVECPLAVWNALDDDDQLAVDEAARPFTPRRLKAAVELFQRLGDLSSGSSPTPSAPQSPSS
jgi:hypothetical protein